MNSEKRYRFFVSSTYRDLVEERQAVQNQIIQSGHIPLGMELFAPSSSSPWEVIKKSIDESDAVILVLGWMYGSYAASDNGERDLSYTEKEYRYARSINKSIIPILHSDQSQVLAGKAETRSGARAALAAFRSEVQSQHLVGWYSSIPDLAMGTQAAISAFVANSPAAGLIPVSTVIDLIDKGNVEELMQMLR